MSTEMQKVWQRTLALEKLKAIDQLLAETLRVLAGGPPGVRPAPAPMRRALVRLQQQVGDAQVRVKKVPVTKTEKILRRKA